MARLDYFAPGVYVEEVNKGSRAIQGISMSVAGFVGFSEDVRGDAELFEPILITNWGQYLENFAKVGSDGFACFEVMKDGRREKAYPYLPFAVKGWFDNGGGRCWVVSIGTRFPIHDDAPPLEAENPPPALTPVTTSGRQPSLSLRLKPEKEEEGRVTVTIERDEPLPPEDPNEEPFNTGEYFKVTVRRGGEVLEQFEHLTMKPASDSEPADQLEDSQGYYVEEALQESEYLDLEITAEEGLPLAQKPADGAYEVRPRAVPYRTRRWYRETYGSANRRSGIQGLFEVDEIAMVACPDLMLAYQQELISLQQLHGLMEVMITACENAAPGPAYRMVVLDPPPVKTRRSDFPVRPEQQKPQDVEQWLMDSFGRRSQFAALYYPWIEVPNPKESGKPITIPPCGHMMGLWCRTDESRGIHKAPANEMPRG
ncbi:MAG: phage tail sheath family protein, partial [Leptolyngbya sp. SIO4C5]|nr:phage tail sheath family protein [Leptolyngbya sp. SIO4C5]